MSEAETHVKFGQVLPDQVERIAELFDTHLQVIDDVRDLYTARAALERDYAAKLQVLIRKASDKKAKSCAALVLGSDPTKSWDENTLTQSTLERAYDTIIDSMTSTAQDHINFADAIATQTIETLRIIEKRNDDAKKKEILFFQKLLSDRDRVYSDRLKSKQKYDDQCAEVESFRQKQGRASDDRHADRAARQAEQQRNDMVDAKNAYLIAIAVANRSKSKFYSELVPNLENELQDLHRRLMERFVKILIQAQEIHTGHLDTLQMRVANVRSRLEVVDLAKDQALFATYNLRTFSAPEDWKFEPSSIHYDTDAMNVELAPKVVIQNKMRRSQEKLLELRPLIESKRSELNNLTAQVSAYTADYSVGTIDDLTDKYLEAEHQLALYATSELILSTEIDSISNVVGEDTGGSRPHSFKSSLFSIPTTCGYCKSSIWGLSKQGKTCKTCGLSVHAKCELKVSADCAESEESHTSMLFRKGTNASRSGLPGTPVAPSASSFVQSISSEATSTEERVSAKVMFDFDATSEFELGVQDGEIVHIVESDDGSGWVKVENHEGNSGLVPASYLAICDGEVGEESGDTSKKRVRALYPYKAQGSDELSLQSGETLELSTGPRGGENYGDGWWEGFNEQGRRGIFPSNYVEPI
ncbi:hypothetical protein BDN70DRAFT_997635 [Pholiota conissans]|uniref:Uncharacterized protein n=1 Tax=Pholiota conissans TaxID=109636 RepID=A0A9P5YPA9_9AGAR|nr:hypothetical protein BDN70DRAFT_997635 [Pholiota conissans]